VREEVDMGYRHLKTCVLLSVVAFVLGTTSKATAEYAKEPTYPEDFCDALDDLVTIVNDSSLAMALLGEESRLLVDSMACATADINGSPTDTTVPPDGVPNLASPNGMLDGSFELGLIEFVLNNQGELQQETRAAYELNYALLAGAFNDPACSYCPLWASQAPGLVEALIRTLAGFAIVGDDATLESFTLLHRILTRLDVEPPSVNEYSVLKNFYGPEGDADGDGCTNRQEYQAFFEAGAAVYVANALDKGVTPDNCDDVGEGEGAPPEMHAADQNGDGAIGLSELLRVIQFYNSDSYGCQPGTEDDFAPNDPDQTCAPHSSDYSPQNWIIALSELLRVIQFYNFGGYQECVEGEDGFCPGL
jgi:hypothetical protein